MDKRLAEMDRGLTKVKKILLSIDFFTKERILTQKESKMIMQYILGEGILISNTEEYQIDESECSLE